MIVKFCRWLLRCLHYYLIHSQRASLKYARPVLLVTSVIMIGSVFVASRIKVGIRPEDWLDKRLPSTQQYLELKESFGSEDKLTWVVPTEWTNESLCLFQKPYFEWLYHEKKLSTSAAVFDLRGPIYDNVENTLHYPLVLEKNCAFLPGSIERLRAHPLVDAMSLRPGHDLMFHFTLRELDEPTKWGLVDFVEADRWVQKLRNFQPSGLLGGSLFFQKSTRDGIQWAGKLNLLTAALIILCSRIFLGTWLSGLILALVVYFTTTILQAGMVLRNEVVDPLSSSLFILMAIAIIEDYFFAFHLTRLKGIQLRTSLRRMILPGSFTSLTTAFGFGALITSENMSLQNLGFWTALGTMIECAMIFLLIPALLKVFPTLNTLPSRGNIWMPKWLSRLGNVKPTRRGVLMLTLPMLLIFYTYDKVNINYSPFDMFPTSHPLVQFRDYVKNQRGFEGEVSLVFNQKELTAEDSDRIAEVAKHPLVASYKDPYKVTEEMMPSGADEALKRLIRDEVKNTANIKTYQANGQSRAILFVNSIDLQSIEALARHTEKICAGHCYLGGEIIAFKDYALSILNTLYSSFVSSLIPVLLTMAFLCLASSGRILWPILLATIWAPVTLLILVSVLQIKVNVVTCIAMSLLIGLAGDNAIQFLLFDRHGRWTKGLDQLKHSTLLILAVMAMIGMVLLLSSFRSARILSGLIVLGVFLLLVGELWILNHFTQIEKPDPDKRK